MKAAYAAGLFDGEGMIRIASHIHRDKVTRIYQLHATIGVNFYPVVVLLKKKYGGSIHENRHDLRNPRNRIQFNWVATSQQAAAFLRDVRPHLIIKADQADLALEFQANVDEWAHKLGSRAGFHPDRDKVFAWRAEVAQRLSELKKVAFPSLVERGPAISERSLTG